MEYENINEKSVVMQCPECGKNINITFDCTRDYFCCTMMPIGVDGLLHWHKNSSGTLCKFSVIVTMIKDNILRSDISDDVPF